MPPLCILPDNPYLSKNLIAFTFLAGPTHIKSFYFIFVLKSARKPKSLTKLRIFFFFWGGGGGGGYFYPQKLIIFFPMVRPYSQKIFRNIRSLTYITAYNSLKMCHHSSKSIG